MVIRIHGKGLKGREVMLSKVLLEALQEHWKRHRPKEWLFPGGKWHTSSTPITSKVAWQACRQAAKRCGLEKKVHPCYAARISRDNAANYPRAFINAAGCYVPVIVPFRFASIGWEGNGTII
jgi:hypothetical protein